MSRFHALFSLGGMLGAGAGGLVAGAQIGPLPHFAVAAIIFLFATLAISPLFLHNAPPIRGAAHRLPLRQIPPILLALSAIGFFILLTEGAMADWTGLYLRQILGAGPALAAAGYAVFSSAMALFRLMGDFITARFDGKDCACGKSDRGTRSGLGNLHANCYLGVAWIFCRRRRAVGHHSTGLRFRWTG